jgi:2-keto-4-pentenoate hydratase
LAIEMNDLDAEGCAAHIAARRASGEKLDGHALALHAPDGATGYEMQRRVSELIAGQGGGEVTGYKLGMTSPALQAQFGIDEPLYGPVYAGGHIAERDCLPVLGAPRPIAVECEVAITLALDLGSRDRGHDAASVADAIRTFHVAIEVVENRFVSLEKLSPWIVVADGVLHRGYVLGPGVERPHPGLLAGELRLDGAVLSAGKSDTLWRGGPVESLAWLANKLNANGRYLRAGDVVLCGSLGSAAWVTSGPSGSIVASIPELGSIELRLA